MLRTAAFLFIPRNLSRLLSVLGFMFSPTFPDNLAPALGNIRLYILQLEVKAMTWWGQNLYELATDVSALAFGYLADLRSYQYVAPPIKAPKNRVVEQEEEVYVPLEIDQEDGFDNNDGDDINREHRHHRRDRDRDRDSQESDDHSLGGGDDNAGDDNGSDDNGEDQDNQEEGGDNNDASDAGGDDPLADGLENVGMYGGAGPQDLPDGGPDDDPSSTAVRCSSFAPLERKKPQTGRPDHRHFASMLEACLVKCPTLLSPLEYAMKPVYATIASSSPCSSSCTLVTQCSVDRFPQLESQIIAWDGALSVAIYVPSPDHHETLAEIDIFLTRLRETLPATCVSYYIVVSLLYGHECDTKKHLWDRTSLHDEPEAPLYPINNLRNLSVSAARSTIASPLLFLVDVDFVPSTGLSSWIEQSNSPTSSNPLVARCDSGDIFVVPAFERDTDFEMDSKNMTESLMTGWACGLISPFHTAHFPAGHQPTDFERSIFLEPFCLPHLLVSLPPSFPVSSVDGEHRFLSQVRSMVLARPIPSPTETTSSHMSSSLRSGSDLMTSGSVAME
jgi:hypothetical protein